MALNENLYKFRHDILILIGCSTPRPDYHSLSWIFVESKPNEVEHEIIIIHKCHIQGVNMTSKVIIS